MIPPACGMVDRSCRRLQTFVRSTLLIDGSARLGAKDGAQRIVALLLDAGCSRVDLSGRSFLA